MVIMLKSTSRKLVTSVLLLTTFTGSAYAGPSDTGTSYKNLVGSTSGKSEVIKDEIKNFQVLIDSGAMEPHQAVDTFSKNLTDEAVSFSDLDAYVKERSTRDEYGKFQASFETAMAGVDARNITATEMSQVSAQLLTSQASVGLSWSGCAGIGVGVAILVAAVVVGIVAIVKSASVAQVTADYENQISNAKSSYYHGVIDIQNQPQTSVNEIAGNNGTIENNNGNIRSLENQINNLDPNTANYDGIIQSWTNEENNLIASNNQLVQDNNNLNANMSNWNDPNYKAAQLASYRVTATDYIASLQTDEVTAIQMVPADQVLAKSLGIGAGIGAAVGIYLLVDGLANNDGC